MNSKVEQPEQAQTGADIAMYLLAALLLAGGLFAFYWFGEWPAPARGAVALGGFLAALATMAFTHKGRQAREFVSESLFELRKVVWPTQQETRRLTGVILLVVVIVSLILSGFDFVISWAVRLLLGQ